MSHVKVTPLALLVVLVLSCSVFGVKEASRSYVIGDYALTLDGVKCGFRKSVEDGAITGEVINDPVGPDYIIREHLGKPKYEDFEMQVGFGMTKSVDDRVQRCWTAKPPRVKGSITTMDFKLQPQSERQFFNIVFS